MSMSTNEGNVTRVTVDLILSEAYRDDAGVYVCSVSNPLESVEINTTLTIQCKQAISICLYGIVVEEALCYKG